MRLTEISQIRPAVPGLRLGGSRRRLWGVGLGLVAVGYLGLAQCALDERVRSAMLLRPEENVKGKWQGIVWPSLGHPEPVWIGESGGECIVLVRLSDPRDEGVDDVRGRLIPVAPPVKTSPSAIDLELVEGTSQPLASIEGLGRWSDWMLEHAPEVRRLRFRVPAVTLPAVRRSALYDLEVTIGDRVFTKPGGVFLRRESGEGWRLLLASDVHVAARWEEIAEDFRGLFPSADNPDRDRDPCAFDARETWSADAILRSFVNPNRNLAHLIRQANALADRGEIDALFLTGDLVDYKFQRPRPESGTGYEATEWALLTRILLGEVAFSERLRVPLYTTTGNHDYRLYPYKLQIYGIRHCGIAQEITREYLRRSGNLLRFKYRFGDLNAVRISSGKRHSLEYYHRDFSPFDDYTLELGGLRVVALDSGSDFFCHPSHLRTRRWRRYLAGLANAVAEPASDGLSDHQVAYLRQQITQRPEAATLLITHAPLLNPGDRTDPGADEDDEHALPIRIEPGAPPPGKRATIAFEKELAKRELNHGTLFRNPLPVLSALAAHRAPLVVFSGHTHRRLGVTLDRRTGQFHAGPYVGQGDLGREPDSRVLLIQTPALGHIKRGDLRHALPAYQILTFAEGEIREVAMHRLGAEPFRQWAYEWESSSPRANEERIRFYFERTAVGQPHRETFHKVVCWLRPRRGKLSAEDAARLRLLPQDETVIASSRDRRRPEEGGYVSFLLKEVPTWELTVRNRASGVILAFVFETFERVDGELVSLGLRRHHRDLD